MRSQQPVNGTSCPCQCSDANGTRLKPNRAASGTRSRPSLACRPPAKIPVSPLPCAAPGSAAGGSTPGTASTRRMVRPARGAPSWSHASPCSSVSAGSAGHQRRRSAGIRRSGQPGIKAARPRRTWRPAHPLWCPADRAPRLVQRRQRLRPHEGDEPRHVGRRPTGVGRAGRVHHSARAAHLYRCGQGPHRRPARHPRSDPFRQRRDGRPAPGPRPAGLPSPGGGIEAVANGRGDWVAGST